MTRTTLLPLAFALLAMPLSAAAAPAPSSDEPIVIIGAREGSKMLEVDFDRVWRQQTRARQAR